MITTGYPSQGGIAQATWNDPSVLKQYAPEPKPPQSIGERLNEALARIHTIEAIITNVNDRIYGPVPRGVSQAAGGMGGNHLAVLAELAETISRCEEEAQRLDRGL